MSVVFILVLLYNKYRTESNLLFTDMTQLHMVISHNLEYSDALKRIKGLLKELKAKHAANIGNVRQHWKQGIGFFSFSAKGISMQGVIVVGDDSITIAGDLPWQAGLFKKQIEAAIRKQAHKLLK